MEYGLFPDSMVQSPPHSSKAYHHSPLIFTPQVRGVKKRKYYSIFLCQLGWHYQDTIFFVYFVRVGQHLAPHHINSGIDQWFAYIDLGKNPRELVFGIKLDSSVIYSLQTLHHLRVTCCILFAVSFFIYGFVALEVRVFRKKPLYLHKVVISLIVLKYVVVAVISLYGIRVWSISIWAFDPRFSWAQQEGGDRVARIPH